MEKRVALISFVGLVAIFMFLAGYGYRHFNIWPSRDISLLLEHYKDYSEYGYWGRPKQFMKAPRPEDGMGAKVVEPSEMIRGYRAIMGYDGDLRTYSVRLYDSDGVLLHKWRVSYQDLAPGYKDNWEINPHGLFVLPDASIVSVLARGVPAETF